MAGKRWFTILAVIAMAVGLGYAGFRTYQASRPEECYACRRPLHAHSETLALVNGQVKKFCCPACALSEHEQEGKPVRVTQLTEYYTGANLSPDDAFIVKGSDVNMCARTREVVSADKRAADLHYDRCAPSMLAFAKRDEAAQFARQHGGEILLFSQVASAYVH